MRGAKMITVIVKHRGRFIDEMVVDTDDPEHAVELARDKVKELLDVSVRIVLEYDGELLDEPCVGIDRDELLDRIIDEEFEFEPAPPDG